MSINHFSTHPLYCSHRPNMEPNPNSSLSYSINHPQKPNSSSPFWINNPPQPNHPLEDNKLPQQQQQQVIEREPMFEKPLTPSDVGKLNRLVIPKQYAEKHLPLVGDSVENKGLLLSFEDELGKCWRFRYSYWSSSQSYVLTKGWSRYVKEKQLDAGDVVLFQRHRTDGERLFIGWRRRGGDNNNNNGSSGGGVMVQGNSGGTWCGGLYSSYGHQVQPYQQHPLGANLTACVPYQPECLHAGTGGEKQAMPIGNSKRLRLFGVNLECQLDESSEPWTPDGSSVSTQVLTQHQCQL